MSGSPYPPYPPNIAIVDKVGGFKRTCIVIDLCTSEPLTSAEIAQIEDQIGLTLAKIKAIYRLDIANSSRFTKPLRIALQLE
jgi:hypothetical protein